MQPILSAIQHRRSIRKYQDAAVPQPLVEQVLRAGTLAPSSKNRQPWQFVVVSGQSKKEMLWAMQQGLRRERRLPLLPNSKQHLPGAEHTLEIMKQAPVTIFVVNPLGASLSAALTPEERIYEICNAQSVGAAIENMTLQAAELGLGSLWICDIFFAYQELCDWLQAGGQLIAALALGYAAETPPARPRKLWQDTVQWRG